MQDHRIAQVVLYSLILLEVVPTPHRHLAIIATHFFVSSILSLLISFSS